MLTAAAIVIYAGSFLGDVAFVGWYFSSTKHPRPFSMGFLPGIAGFSVFPIINTVIAVILAGHLMGWNRAGRPDNQ